MCSGRIVSFVWAWRERMRLLGACHLLVCMRLFGSHSLACLISPLKKITVGMFLASMSFVVAAVIQLQIDVSCSLILQWPSWLRHSGGVFRSLLSSGVKSEGRPRSLLINCPGTMDHAPLAK